jgi:ATP-dependent DNA ligase
VIVFPPPSGKIEVALARAVDFVPESGALRGGCVYEIKIDGWRLIVVNPLGKGSVELWSRRGSNLTAAFPEVAEAVAQQVPRGCCLDGEVTVWREGGIDWDQLSTRIGAAAGSAGRARAAPASYLVFDLLALAGEDLRGEPWAERRGRLEELAAAGQWAAPLELVPFTSDRAEAERWASDYAPFGIEGLVVKGRATPYRPGRRDWLKWKLRVTSEAIIGAVTGSVGQPESLVIGRYSEAGEFVMVGRSAALRPDQAADLAAVLQPVPADRHPWPVQIGGWFGESSADLVHVAPTAVVEIAADSARLGVRYRHAVRYLRRRPDLTVEDVNQSEAAAQDPDRFA